MELNIEAAAKKHAESIVKAALTLTEEKRKCKDYGHAGPKCGADDCWLRDE